MNYYGKFIPQLSTHLAPLYKLLEKDKEWQWSEECEGAFCKCKSLLSSDAVLVHYDTKKPLRLVCDASSYGLGIVLPHVLSDGEHPIAYAPGHSQRLSTIIVKLRKKRWLWFLG